MCVKPNLFICRAVNDVQFIMEEFQNDAAHSLPQGNRLSLWPLGIVVFTDVGI